MKRLIKIIIILLIITMLSIILLLFYNKIKNKDKINTEIRISSFGGGGALFNPLINEYNNNQILINSDMQGNYISYDNGNSFIMNSFGYRIYSTYIRDENTIYYGGSGLLKSIDNGKIFNQIYPEYEDISYRGYQSEKFFINKDNDEQSYHQIRYIDSNNNDLFLITKLNYNDNSNLLYSNDDTNFTKLLEFNSNYLHKLFFYNNLIYILTDNNIIEFNIDTLKSKIVYENKIIDGKLFNNNFYLIVEDNSELFYNKIIKIDLEINNEINISSKMTEGIINGKRKFSKIDVANDNTIVVGYGSNYLDGYGISITKDEGKTWKVINERDMNFNSKGYIEDKGYSGDSPIGLDILDNNSNKIIYSTLVSAYMTVDLGESFISLESKEIEENKYISKGLDLLNVNNVSINPNNGNNIIVNYNDMGIGVSFDKGNTYDMVQMINLKKDWKYNSYGSLFIPNSNIVLTTWTNRHNLLTSPLEDNEDIKGGLSISYDNGITHKVIDYFNEDSLPIDIKYFNNEVYVCIYNYGVYKTNDLINFYCITNNLDENYFYRVEYYKNKIYLLISEPSSNYGKIYYLENDKWINIDLPKDSYVPTDFIFYNDKMYLSFMTSKNKNDYPYSWMGGGAYEYDLNNKEYNEILNNTKSVMDLNIYNDNLYIVGYQFNPIRYNLKNNKIEEILKNDYNNFNKIVITDNNIYLATAGIGLWIINR